MEKYKTNTYRLNVFQVVYLVYITFARVQNSTNNSYIKLLPCSKYLRFKRNYKPFAQIKPKLSTIYIYTTAI